jgi:hypothetical protein
MAAGRFFIGSTLVINFGHGGTAPLTGMFLSALKTPGLSGFFFDEFVQSPKDPLSLPFVP